MHMHINITKFKQSSLPVKFKLSSSNKTETSISVLKRTFYI